MPGFIGEAEVDLGVAEDDERERQSVRYDHGE